LITFSSIAENYLKAKGYQPYLCKSEEEARNKIEGLIAEKKWPCYFSPSNTTGEKPYEEFFTEDEDVDFETFKTLGIVKNNAIAENEKFEMFLKKIDMMIKNKEWTKKEIVDLFFKMIPNLDYEEKGKFLDDKM
jgi:hypothetical protein